jgi:hypothetical protein
MLNKSKQESKHFLPYKHLFYHDDQHHDKDKQQTKQYPKQYIDHSIPYMSFTKPDSVRIDVLSVLSQCKLHVQH